MRHITWSLGVSEVGIRTRRCPWIMHVGTCMRQSPCSTKCSAVVTVRSARTTPSCTASPLLSLHFEISKTTCIAPNTPLRFCSHPHTSGTKTCTGTIWGMCWGNVLQACIQIWQAGGCYKDDWMVLPLVQRCCRHPSVRLGCSLHASMHELPAQSTQKKFLNALHRIRTWHAWCTTPGL